jgi:hypothetical protein
VIPGCAPHFGVSAKSWPNIKLARHGHTPSAVHKQENDMIGHMHSSGHSDSFGIHGPGRRPSKKREPLRLKSTGLALVIAKELQRC